MRNLQSARANQNANGGKGVLALNQTTHLTSLTNHTAIKKEKPHIYTHTVVHQMRPATGTELITTLKASPPQPVSSQIPINVPHLASTPPCHRPLSPYLGGFPAVQRFQKNLLSKVAAHFVQELANTESFPSGNRILATSQLKHAFIPSRKLFYQSHS